MKRKITFILMILFCIISLLHADNKTDANQVIQETVNSVIELLKDTAMEKQYRREKIMEILSPVFDFDLMAKLALGKECWPKVKGEQRKEFIDLFVKQLEGTYLDKVELFSGETIKFHAPKQVKTKIHILTTLVTKGDPIKIMYKVYKKKETWKIYDLEIQDVSLIKSYSSQYRDFLDKSTVDELLEEMRNKFKKTKTG